MAKPPAKKAVKASPRNYSAKRKAEIIAHVLSELSGGRAVVRILREDAGMPAPSLFWQWHFDDIDLQDKVARARQNGVESVVDETIDISNTPMLGRIVRHKFISDGEGGMTPVEEVTEEDMLGHRKLQIETRLKYAAMIAPRKYGPKLDLTSAGEKLGLSDAIAEGRRRAEKGLGGE